MLLNFIKKDNESNSFCQESMKNRIIALLVSAANIAVALAVPAKPGFIKYTQPDGTMIDVKISGDEFGHMLFSKDGMLLVESDGRIEYASFDAYGHPIASGIAVEEKSMEMNLALRLQPKEKLQSWIEKVEINREKMKENCSQDHIFQDFESAENEGSTSDAQSDRLVPQNFGRCEGGLPVIGERRELVILVEYQDVAFEYGTFNYFNRMLNEEGFSDYGSLSSARDWFIENSSGLFLPTFDVYGPVKLPENRAYYGSNDIFGNDMRAHEMAIQALRTLDDDVDFSLYDEDDDGKIDNVFIIYAGNGEHDTPGLATAVWPHSWEISEAETRKFYFDGVRLDRYACTCEHPYGVERPDGIGTFIHEFSHAMGLPDLYATNNNKMCFTPGRWSVLDVGPYNNEGLTPPNYSSFEKCALGWLEFIPMEEGDTSLPYLEESNVAYFLPTPVANEFFFFENRQQSGNDAFLPGHGMLVWHVDYKKIVWKYNSVNNNHLHNYVDIVEADGICNEPTRGEDAFPGTKNVTEFGFLTNPRLSSWKEKQLMFDLVDIDESEEGIISFKAVESIPISDTPEEVSEICNDDSDTQVYFDITGRRVKNPQKGIYILKGKKHYISD